jgi:hypothetical protein
MVKIMADQLAAYPEYHQMMDTNCFKIRMRRMDRIAQIASHYVATVTDRWSRKLEEHVPEYQVPLDIELLHRSINIINQNELLLNQLDDSVFDQDLIYESLGHIDSYTELTAQPINIDEIKYQIEQLTIK